MSHWERAERWLSPARFALILALLVAIQFPGVLAGFETFFFRDFGFFGYPLAAYHRDSFWQGEIPFWNPYNNAGLPFLGQWNTMVLYPGSFIYLLLPMPWGLNVFCLAHQYLAGLGMFHLARATTKSNFGGTIAGIAFAFSGLIFSSLKWPNNIAAFGLMPWVVLACLRTFESPGNARIALAALVGAIQMLTGAPEVIILTWVVIGTLAFAEAFRAKNSDLNSNLNLSPKTGSFRLTPLLTMAGIVVLVSLLSAAQILPFLDLLKLSQRTEKFGGSDWPMPIWGWINFLLPLYKTFPSYHGVPAQPNQYWISTYYVALGALALGLLSLVQRGRPLLLASLALLGGALALGEPGHVYAIARDVFPPIGFMRFPIKFVVLPVFLLAWMSAYGVESLRTTKLRVFGIWAAILIFGCLFQLHKFPDRIQLGTYDARIWFNTYWRVAFLIGFAVLISIFLSGRRTAFAISSLIAVLWLDAHFHAPQQNPAAPNWVFDRGLLELKNRPHPGEGRAALSAEAALKMDHLQFDKPEEDIGATRLALFCNANLIDRIPKIDGFFALYLRESQQLIDLIYANTNRNFPGLEKALAVSHRTAPGKTREWMDDDQNLPWISGGQVAAITNTAEIVRRIADPQFDPASLLYLPTNAPATIGAGRVKISDLIWTPHRVRFTAGATQPAWVFISQAFHHGWSAAVNGRPVEIQRSNHAFQAIAIPANGANLELTYREPRFGLGVALSLIGLLFTAGLLFKRA